MCNILHKDIPFHQAYCVHFTGCGKFLKEFCAIRWNENIDVAKWELEILPSVVKFVKTEKKKRKKNYNSYGVLYF